MSRAGAVARLVLYGLAFLVLVGPHWLVLRRAARGRGGRLAGRIPVLLHRFCLRLYGVRVSVHGQGPPPGEATLVLANHLSWLDIPVLGALAPLSFVAKSEIAAWPVVGTLARLQRTVFVERERRYRTAEVNDALAARLIAGDAVVLFAEGTTGDGNRVLPFRAALVGAARAALARDGAPGLERVRLQPLGIAYTARHGLPLGRAERPDVAWYGDAALAPSVAAFLRGGPLDARVVWGEPIVFGPGSDRKAATAAAHASVRRALQEAVTGRARMPPRREAEVPEPGMPEPGIAEPGIAEPGGSEPQPEVAGARLPAPILNGAASA